MASLEKYINYSKEDFINDPFFQDWVLDNNEEGQHFWKQVIEAYPDKKALIEDARSIIKTISFKEDKPEEAIVQQALTEHLKAIKDLKDTRVIQLNRVNRFKSFLRIAAVVIGIAVLASAVFIFKSRNEKLIAETGFGEIQSVVLPDSSLVILNAHSKIEYPKRWKPGSKREVWLEGEAFFEVKHPNKNPNQIKVEEQFLLHTKNLAIEVLGTQFDVRERRGKTEVVLQSGSIKVMFNDKANETVFMKPGDMITYNGQRYDKSTAVPENYSAWKERKLLLKDPTVNEILQYLEDDFGKKIILQKPEQGKIKIEGPIMISNLDDALFILSTVLSSDVIKKNDSIIIRPR